PAYCTANGKALLAGLDPAEVTRLLPEHLDPQTPTTIRTRTDLLAHLAQIRESGIATDHDEHTSGISAVGAVVHGSWGLAAISVPMPTQRFTGREPTLVAALRATLTQIEALD